MADKAKNVVLNFKMDGQVQYADTLKQINMVMNTAAKEYKNHIAAMGKDASVTDKLRAEKKKLEIQMEAAQKRTKMLSDEFESMSKDTNTTAEELNKMYGKLLDAQNAETSLQKSLDRVNGGLSEQAQEARSALESLDGLKSESKLLEAEQKSLTSSFKLQNAELGDNATEAEKLELAQKQLKSQMDLTERTVQNLEKQLDATKKVYGENSVEVMQMEAKLNNAKSTVSEFKKSLDGVESSSKSAGNGIETLSKKMDINNMLEATELLQGMNDKLLELGKVSMDSALSFGDSQSNLQANLGLTAKEAEKLNGVVEEVFKNGVVESTEEASQAVMLVKRSFGDLDNTDLEKITNKITTLAKRTGTDVTENVRGAEKLMKSFGISGDEALDLIAAGYQNGLNKSDDFMDTLNEYSPHFKSAGFSAKEMMEIINNGMENGAMNTDKAADAVKEFQIRLGDGSFEKIIGDFSKGTKDTFEEWKNGKATVADVAESVSKDLNKMTPTEQQQALSSLSSQFEDLGVNGAAALFSVGKEFDNVNGKADEMAQKSPGEQWQSSLRELQTSLLPIGQNLVDGLTPVVDTLAKVGEWFSKLPGPAQTFITVFGGIIIVAAILAPLIIGLVAAFASLNIALFPIIAVVVGVAAAIAGIIVVIKNWGAITDWLNNKWKQFSSWLSTTTSNLSKNFVKGFNDMKDGAVKKFNELRDKAGNVITSFKNNVEDKASQLKTGFVNKVSELKDGAINKFNSLRDKAGSVMTQAKDKILSPIESAKEKISGIVQGIVGFFSGMKLKIPKIDLPKLPHFSLKGDFSLVPPSVPKLSVDWRAKGAIFTRPTIFGATNGRLQGAGDAGPEAALPLNEATLGAIGNGILNATKGIGNTINIKTQDDPNAIARATERALRRVSFGL